MLAVFACVDQKLNVFAPLLYMVKLVIRVKIALK